MLHVNHLLDKSTIIKSIVLSLMKRTVEKVDVDAIFDKEIINIREFNGSYVSDISFIFSLYSYFERSYSYILNIS